MAKRPTDAQRKKVFQRAKGFCEYCFSPEKYSNSTFEVEHIFPLSRGGKTVLANLALSCSGCNKYKSHRIEAVDAETGETVALYHPRKNVWSEHFAWNENFMEIVGSSACGRVTIETLRLNRKSLKNLRKLLHLFGEHPSK